MKKILIGGMIVLSIFLIYLTTIDKKVYYLALGDSLAVGINSYNTKDYGYTDNISDYLSEKHVLEKYVNGFAMSGYRTTDLYRDIVDNRSIVVFGQKVTIKQSLVKADLVTVSIGVNDLLSRSSTSNLFENSENDIIKYINEIMLDTDKLFSLIRQYCKEDIILIGYYNPISDVIYEDKADKIFKYINSSYEKLCSKYDIYYIDVYEMFKSNINYLPNPYNMHPSRSGYKAIADLVINKMNATLFE